MSAPLRTVAADAGVSAGLILHHFGSRAGLREACDDYVLALTRESKSSVLRGDASPTSLLVQMAQVEQYAPVVGYVLRCLQAGGGMATRFVDHMVADAVAYLDAAVADGTVRPSRDPEARARYMVEMALGALLLQPPAQQEHLDLDELPHWLRGYTERIVLPALEMYTEPLLVERTLLDSYLASLEARPDDGASGRTGDVASGRAGTGAPQT